MIVVSILQRAVLATFVVVLMTMVGAGQAVAVEPWWHLNTVSAPASTPAGEDRIVVEASDVGDAMVRGFENPVTIVDKLPAGVTATAVYGEGGGTEVARGGARPATNCSLATLTCTFSGPLLEYERLMIAIVVKVAPGAGNGENEVSVSGGGAPALVSRGALALADPPPYGVENYEFTPEEEGGAPDTQAGSHPFQLTATLGLNAQSVPTGPGDQREGVHSEVQPLALTKDLHFNLPPGVVGNPTPLPQCSDYVFTQSTLGHDECPADSAVGVATVVVTNVREGTEVPWGETKPVYNLTPSVGEPAKFAFQTLAGPVVLDTSVRTGGDYGVVVTVNNIIQNIGFIGSEVTLWGDPGDPRHNTARGLSCLDASGERVAGEEFHWEFSCPGQENGQPFLLLPTSCAGPLQASVEADSWVQPEQRAVKQYEAQTSAGARYGQDGCNRLNFEPSISVAPDGQQGSTPTGLTVGVHVPQEASLNPTGLAESTVKDTTVVLPAGVAINPAGADGLQACSLSEVGLESPANSLVPKPRRSGQWKSRRHCCRTRWWAPRIWPNRTRTRSGAWWPCIWWSYDPVSGVRVKVAGEVKPDPVTGQLVSTFEEHHRAAI